MMYCSVGNVGHHVPTLDFCGKSVAPCIIYDKCVHKWHMCLLILMHVGPFPIVDIGNTSRRKLTTFWQCKRNSVVEVRFTNNNESPASGYQSESSHKSKWLEIISPADCVHRKTSKPLMLSEVTRRDPAFCCRVSIRVSFCRFLLPVSLYVGGGSANIVGNVLLNLFVFSPICFLRTCTYSSTHQKALVWVWAWVRFENS